MCPLKVKYEWKDVAFLFNYTNILKTALPPYNSSQITSYKITRIEGGGNSDAEDSRPYTSTGKQTTAERLSGLDCEWIYRLWSCFCCFFLLWSQIRLHQSGSTLLPLPCSPNFCLALQGSELITEARDSHLFPSLDVPIVALLLSRQPMHTCEKELGQHATKRGRIQKGEK